MNHPPSPILFVLCETLPALCVKSPSRPATISRVLNVLQLIPTLDRSGAEKQMVLLAKGLPRDRFHVEVAALTRLGPLESELREAGVPVTLIGKKLKADPFALGRLTRFMKERKFDVVQTWIYAASTY